MSTHNLCFEQKYEKYQSFLPEKLSVFGGEIFYIFEQACFRNVNIHAVFFQSCFFINQRVFIFFLSLHKNIHFWYSLEGPYLGASNEYPQHLFSWRNKKNIYLIAPLI